jgi:hypothetical protein
MTEYVVNSTLDFYKAGDIASDEWIAEQTRRGNMPDLLRKGRIEPIAGPQAEEPPHDYSALTVKQLQAIARERDVPYHGKRKAELVEALEAD